MKITLILYLVFGLIFETFSQSTSHYVGEDYGIDLNSNRNLGKEQVSGVYQDNFTILNSKGAVIYLFNVVSIANIGDSFEFLSSSSYKNNYLKTCNCNILAEEQMEVNGYRAVKYHYEIKNGKLRFLGDFISLIENGKLYTLTYNTIDRNFEKYHPQIEKSLMTFKVN